MKFRYLLLIAVLPLNALAQEDEETDWRLYKPAKDSVRSDSADPVIVMDFYARTDSADFFSPSAILNFDTSKQGYVRIKKDNRIDNVLTSLGSPKPPYPVQIDGYRVQLFFDQDRDKVLSQKSLFLSLFSDVRAYTDWDAPYHYLRVGNYYTKQKALKVAEDLKSTFPSATVYHTKIDLPDLD